MVWFFSLILFTSITFSAYSQDINLSNDFYFNLIDINNDKFITRDEVNHLTDLVFQLIDKNQNQKISIEEINELNDIIKLLK